MVGWFVGWLVGWLVGSFQGLENSFVLYSLYSFNFFFFVTQKNYFQNSLSLLQCNPSQNKVFRTKLVLLCAIMFRAISAFLAIGICHLCNIWRQIVRSPLKSRPKKFGKRAHCILSPCLSQLIRHVSKTETWTQLTGCPTHKPGRKAIPEEKRFPLFAVVFPDCAGFAQTAGTYCPLMTSLLTNKLNFNGIFWQRRRRARRPGRSPDTAKHDMKEAGVEHRVCGHAEQQFGGGGVRSLSPSGAPLS